ncbi:MAG: hypothetical protein MUC98_11055 [Desulfobacterota bacterium]|nr:hypothetical protein [Thermodesulfobacteriota bacterium]
MEFISCNSKKSKPKVHVTVCNACKRRRSCDDYSRYRQPLLFPDLPLPGDAKKTRKKRARVNPADPTKRQEQLGMEKLFDRG